MLTRSVPMSGFSEAFAHARETADVLLNRKRGLDEVSRSKVESVRDVFDEQV